VIIAATITYRRRRARRELEAGERILAERRARE